MCDPWGARQCGIDFLNCTLSPTEDSKPKDVANDFPDIGLSSICKCYENEGACLKKFDCYGGAPYYMFHYSCLAEKCGEEVCGVASGLGVSIILVLVSTFFTL